MEIFELDSFSQLENLKIGWDELLSKSLDDNLFSTYEWLSTWWKHFGKGRELKLIITKERGKVSLIAPIMYSTYKLSCIKLRKFEFVATPASDYHVLLIMNFEEAAKAVKPLIEKIRESSVDADCIELEEVPEDSYTAKLLEYIKPNDWKTSSTVIDLCPYITLPESFDILLQNLGPNMRRNLRRWEKQAAKDYKTEFVKYDRIGTLEEAMGIFVELHQKRWTSKNETGAFSDTIFRNFHLDVAKVFDEKGWLALFFLTFNDKPISACYGYQYNGKLYAYLTGFDQDYARYRPGYLTFKNLIKYCVEKGLKEFDFMRGEEEYKKRWKTNIRRNFEFRILKKGFKASLYNWVTNCKCFSYFSRKIGEKISVEAS